MFPDLIPYFGGGLGNYGQDIEHRSRRMGQTDWSWKPDIHENEPVPEIGVKRYAFAKKPSRKVHEINPVTEKSYCQVENGTRQKLIHSSEFPAGRRSCLTCEHVKRTGGEENNSSQPIVTSRKGAGHFYASHEWSELRYKAFLEYGQECVVCGATKNLTVDHIKPLRKHPELAREMSNLQVMCRLCNRGKGAWDETDWRSQ